MPDFLIHIARRVDRVLARLAAAARLLRLRLLGVSVAKDVRVLGRIALVGNPRNLSIGTGTTLNYGVFIDARAPVQIGDHVHISPYARLLTGKLDIAAYEETKRWRHTSAPIRIEDDAWLATGVTIGAGVTIGKGAVIGANAVVLTNVAAGHVAGGIPARVLKRLQHAQS